MIHTLLDQLLNVAGNQFLSGGLVLGAIGAAGVLLRKLPSQLWDLVLRYFTVVVDVSSNTLSYCWLLHWIEAQIYSKRSRRLSVKHIRLMDGKYKTVLVPSRGYHWFIYKHRFLWLHRQVDKESMGAPGSLSEAMSEPKELISIRLVGRSQMLVTDLLKEAETLYETADKNMLHISQYRWSEWQNYVKAKRPLESIFFPPSAEGLLEDIKQFITSSTWYHQMGLPYRRGYLFTGPPGTGKSSAAEAISGAFDLPIFILNLAGMTDMVLQAAVAALNHTTTAILLIEDVDTVSMNRKVVDKSQTASLGTLLNVIDGIQATDNIILIMTSNHPADLDPALLRKGRIDKTIEFGLATECQIRQAVSRFIPHTTIEQCQEIARWPSPLSMAEVQEYLKVMVLR
mgnify:CR=1